MMIKRFLSFILLIIATSLLSISLVLFVFRYKLLSPDFYVNALNDANFYAELEAVIKDNLDSFIQSKLEVDEDNSFGPKLASRILRTVISNIELEQILQETAENNINNITGWLRGQKQLTLYFPKDSLSEVYQGEQGENLFVSQFIEVSGFGTLPDCSDSVLPINFDLANGKLDCVSPEIRERIKNEILAKLPEPQRRDLIGSFLDSVAPGLQEETNIEELVKDNDKSLSMIREVPEKVRTSLYLSIGFIFLSLMLGAFSSLLSPKPALNFLRMTMYSGIMLIILPLITNFSTQVLANFYVWNKLDLPPEWFSEEQRQQIVELFRNTSEALLSNLLTTIIIIGAILLISSIVLIIIFRFARIIKSDEVDYIEEDDEREDLIEDSSEPYVVKSKESFEQEVLNDKSLSEKNGK